MKIYLCGPDVFRHNAKEYLHNLSLLCEKYGFIGLSPFDNESIISEDIFINNIMLMNNADIIIANLQPFRGSNVDDGTAFEIGYCFSKKKLIFGYTEIYNKELIDITYEHEMNPGLMEVENFGHCRNLMIVHSIEQSGGKILETFEDCLKYLKNFK